ncbi:MAG: carboxypeptidase regulatory-like domain-containing protein, partial [Omnitrophica bacterium]|nr:carboxypeptidase regulatory-like domain-containing protein [Candidatus Omnitrophota bacterium]
MLQSIYMLFNRPFQIKALKTPLIVCLFLISLPALAQAGEFTVFGPQSFIRETSAPAIVSNNFSVTNPNTEFFLRIYNGGLEDSEAESVSSSVIAINGTQVLGPKDFNQTVKFVEIPVTLQSQNSIEVEVRGKPGGVLSVRIAGIDNAPPVISNLNPADNAKTEERRPIVSASYFDDISDIDRTSVHIALDGQNVTSQSDITDSYFEYIPPEDLSLATHNISVSVSDIAGNTSLAMWVFTIISLGPPVTEESGFIHGYVFNSRTEQPLQDVSIAIKGVEESVFTDENGKFVFPTPTGGIYELTATKEGYTYAQRKVGVIETRDTTIDPIYLVPQDPQATTITTGGGTATNSTGRVELIFPEGAVPDEIGQINVIATQYEKARELPGPLPEASFFTYAVDFKPDGVTFNKPVTFRLANTLGFAPGTPVPMGYYNKDTFEWEKSGMGAVDETGQWAVFEITHFSPYDCNFPVIPLPRAFAAMGAYIKTLYGSFVGLVNEILDGTDNQNPNKKPADPAGWSADYEAGNLFMEYALPSTRTLNRSKNLTFMYRSEYVKPKFLIKTKTYLDDVGLPGVPP